MYLSTWFNDSICLIKFAQVLGCASFLKAVELSLKDKGEDSYQTVHALATDTEGFTLKMERIYLTSSFRVF